MRRILILCFSVLLLICTCMAVSAETCASTVSLHATVSDNGTCQVTVTALLHLEQALADLTFPVPAEAESITLNGSRARFTKTNTAKQVDLSGIAGAIAGDFSVTLSYTLKDLVQRNENEFLELTMPMLSGFPYPVKKLDFSVSLPGSVDHAPAYSSGYHKADIEKSLRSQVSGNVISGNSVKEMKDHETLTMTLLVPEEMFPQPGIVLPDFDVTNGLMIASAILAVLYWLLALRCKRPRRITAAVPPEGFNAGQMGSVLTRKGVDMTMMVLTWAQLGYVSLQQDKQGRVRVQKRMEMGNERSGFEQRCFKNLFGKRSNLVDTTGYHYALCCQSAEKLPPNIRSFIHPKTGNPLVFRLLVSLTGLFCGAQLAIALTADMSVQWMLVILFAILGAVGAWLITGWADGLFLSAKQGVWLALIVCGIWWITGILCGVGGTVILVLLYLLLAGLMISYGGRRTEAGMQAMSDVLGLRRYLRRLDRSEVERITQSNPEYFFQMLPYALALGVDRAFAKRFGKQPMPRCPYLQLPQVSNMTALQWSTLLRHTVASMDARRQKLRGEKALGILQSLISK